ncbi:unnamed protein product [Rotaria sp. Silwood2]|nr:unnamed protein product [Rotaria sp. Silwood2]
MSTEIKDNNDVHSNDEVNQDNNDVSQEINQPPSSENEQEEKIIQESSVDDKQEIEPPLLTSNNNEFPSETPSIDVSNEKDDDSTAATISEENSSALPISEENSLVLPVYEQDNNTIDDTVQSESLSQHDNTHQLLQTIADKSNKEASLTILNTLVEGDFDLDKNYIIQKPKNLHELFSIFNKMSSSLQAEILSV